MKIVMIGDSAQHKPVLACFLGDRFRIVELPPEAAHTPLYDASIEADDVVVSLNFKRERGSRLRFRLLHLPGAGLDGIDFPSLPDTCSVCNVFEHEIPIAEYVLMAMLQWEIRPERMRFSEETWSQAYLSRVPHGELFGQTIGIIGFGRIGRAVAERARAFGMRVVACSHSAGPAAHLADEFVTGPELRRLLTQADYVVICCPLTTETQGLIGADELRAMRSTAVLINVSRAEIVKERELFEALRDRTIAGAVLDVWYRYPKHANDEVPPANYRFLELPEVVATSHSSAWTVHLPRRRYRFIAENVRRLAAGEPLLNVVREPFSAETTTFPHTTIVP
jgi:phosphoglycerate dehydrogenase-like enzyme